MKYKVGDKVRVKSLDWYRKAPKDILGSIKNIPGPFIVEMSTYCGKMATIIEVEEIIPHCPTYYRLDIDNREWAWSEEMFEELNNNKDMKKSDLKPGMVVETREGKKYLVIEVNGRLYYTSTSGYNPLSDYEEDLTEKFEDLIIDKVYEISEASRLTTLLDESNIYLTLLWKRPKQVELTLDEIAAKFNIPVEQLKIKK